MFDVGKRIKDLRLRKGITVNALANLAGISQSYLRDIELGNKKPTVEYLEYICDALGVSLVGFFEDTSDNEIKDIINSLTKKQKERLYAFLSSMIN